MTEQRHAPRLNDVRRECYDELRKCMTRELHDYYAVHPDWLLDTRSHEKLAMMQRILGRMFKVLDDYTITRE